MKFPPGPEPLRPQEPRLGALLALGLAGFCAFLNVYAAQPLLPLLTATFGASKAAAGLTVSAPNLAVALAAPLVSARAARSPPSSDRSRTAGPLGADAARGDGG